MVPGDVKLIFLSSFLVIGANQLNEIWLYTPNSGVSWPVPESQKSVIYAKHLKAYGLDVSRLRYMTFHVQACNDAFVYLSESYKMDPNKKHYHYVIGAKRGKSILLRRLPKHLNAEVATRLSTPTRCDSLKLFWVSWVDENITIGEVVNSKTKAVSTLIDPEPFPVRSLGVATHYGATGLWNLYASATGNFCLTHNTKGNMDQPFTMSNVINSYQCAMTCENIQTCMGFNYKKSDSICQLIQTGKAKITSNVQGWTYFKKCFNGVCIACF